MTLDFADTLKLQDTNSVLYVMGL